MNPLNAIEKQLDKRPLVVIPLLVLGVMATVAVFPRLVATPATYVQKIANRIRGIAA